MTVDGFHASNGIDQLRVITEASGSVSGSHVYQDNGIYTVTVAWRGTASMTNNTADACGAAAGNFGANLEFRRIMQIPTYIDPSI